MATSVTQQLAQLNEARRIVLGDAQLYPQIVEGILPIIGINARLELQRWGSEFLADTFASPAVPPKIKETTGIRVLQLLKDWLSVSGDDIEVSKGVVQAAASIYEYVFRYIIHNPSDIPTWNLMASIKSDILKKWDIAPAGTRICCIKFVQKVVHVQTPGLFDPRRADKNETSLALVPKDHPLIPPSRLEPEASGLLDRLLNVFHEEHRNSIYVSATVNCLGVLVRTRQSTINRIMSTVLNYNPFRIGSDTMDLKTRMQVKSTEKAIRIFLVNWLKRNDDNPFSSRIKAYIERLERSRLEMFTAESGSRKRGLATEAGEAADAAKRRRLGAEVPIQSEPTPLPPGPVSYAQLFTLTNDAALASFGVWQIPQDLVTRATLAILVHLEAQSLDTAINHVRSRYLTLTREASAARKDSQEGNADDDDEEYEPDFEPAEDQEPGLSSESSPVELTLGPFTFPQPPPLTPIESEQMSQLTINRVFGMMGAADDISTVKRRRPGMNRLAASNYDREGWTTILTRVATRGCVDLIGEESQQTNDATAVAKGSSGPLKLSNSVRETLYRYVLEDFRARIGTAISWLNEEWFVDRVQAKSRSKSEPKPPSTSSAETPNYDYWTLRMLDGIMPYLDSKDKLLLRFLSEIPVVNEQILQRVKSLANDPERIDLAVKAIHYLILLKPPARDLCLDVVEDLWRNNDDAKIATKKFLMKWRPSVLPPASASPPPPSTPSQSPANGSKSPNPSATKGPPALTGAAVVASPAAGGNENSDSDQIQNSHGSVPVAAAS